MSESALEADSTASGAKTVEARKALWAKLNHCLRKLVIAAFVEFSILYVSFAPLVAMPLYNYLLFHPDKKAYDVKPLLEKIRTCFRATAESISFSTPAGVKLHGYLILLPGSRKTVLVSHGNGGNADRQLAVAVDLLKCGTSVLVYDYEGYGQSEGSPSIAGICVDGVAAYDYLVKNRGIRPDSIVLYGNSLGSTVACETARQRLVGGIVLESGIDSLQTLATEKLVPLRAYPSFLFPRPALDNGKLLAGIHPPLLIMHGIRDALIPAAHAASLYERSSAPKKLVILHRGGHSDLAACDSKHYLSTLKEFIDRLS
jgi:fermentation-respiration switch protein FrsA (DUF1100 family)